MDKPISPLSHTREAKRVPAHEKIDFIRWIIRYQNPIHQPVKQLLHYLLSHPLLVQNICFVSDIQTYQTETTLELTIKDPHPSNGFYLQQHGTVAPSYLTHVIQVLEACEREGVPIYCCVIYPEYQTCNRFLRVTEQSISLKNEDYVELEALFSFMEQYYEWEKLQKQIDTALQTRNKESFLQTVEQQRAFLQSFVPFVSQTSIKR